MCGIVGYVGHKHVVPILLEGLHRLEYRGYDSAGIAVMEDGELCRVRMQGKVSSLAGQLAERPFASTIGMGHTRWATHGKPSEANAHPHELVAARRGSPMVLGVGENEMLLASDVAAFLRLTDRVVYLEDNDIVTIRANEYVIDTLADKPVARETERIEWQPDDVELNGLPHYMLKEIFEQPETITNALRGRLIG